MIKKIIFSDATLIIFQQQKKCWKNLSNQNALNSFCDVEPRIIDQKLVNSESKKFKDAKIRR